MQNTRQTIRQNFLKHRKTITVVQQQNAAKKIVERLSQNTIFQNSQHIAAYIAINGEIDVSTVLQLAWQQNKNCYLPVLTTHQSLQFVRYTAEDNLKLNRFNIPEPEITSEKIIVAEQLDLVLTPLVAFDSQGNRLGMGKGYYDRTFSFLQLSQRPTKPYLLGLAYEWQKTDEITPEKWDITLDAVMTEQSLSTFSKT